VSLPPHALNHAAHKGRRYVDPALALGVRMVVSVPRQGLDELVDFAVGVVDVRAGPEPAAPDGDDDAVLRLKVVLDRLGGMNVGEEGDDSAGLTRHS